MEPPAIRAMKIPAATEAALPHEPRLMPFQELRIVLFYILGASLWIIYSDMALDWLTQDPYWSLELQTYKECPGRLRAQGFPRLEHKGKAFATAIAKSSWA